MVRLVSHRLITWILILQWLAMPFSAWAKISKTSKATPPPIPERPSIPAPLASIPTVDPFQCDRQFIYRGEKLNCDSATRQDGERLRPIIAAVPPAVEELNLYQRNRRSVRTAAYIGTLGILIALGGLLLSRQYKDPANNQLTTEGIGIKNAMVFGGLGLSAGSLLYGITVLRTNERHLGQAVQNYNDANPNDPIQIQFSTGIVF